MKLYVIVETNHATGEVAIPFCSDSRDAALEKAKNLALSRESRTPAIDWVVKEIGDVQLGKTAMADISDNYCHELVRTSVLYSLKDQFPGLDEASKSVQELIDSLTHRACKNIDCGCDEDWSVDEAFREMRDEVCRVCGTE